MDYSKNTDAVIVCGADINNYEYVISQIHKDSFYIYCDSGLKHYEKLNINPDLIIGDFDSFDEVYADSLNAEKIKLPVIKDDTDSVYAIKEAKERGFKNVTIIGAAGNRLDHTLVNVYALTFLYENDICGKIIDDYSEIKIVGNKACEEITDDYPYFSLITLNGLAKGVNIENAKYTLKDAEINSNYQFATSNEVIKGKTAKVSVKEGLLLLIKVKKC